SAAVVSGNGVGEVTGIGRGRGAAASEGLSALIEYQTYAPAATATTAMAPAVAQTMPIRRSPFGGGAEPAAFAWKTACAARASVRADAAGAAAAAAAIGCSSSDGATGGTARGPGGGGGAGAAGSFRASFSCSARLRASSSRLIGRLRRPGAPAPPAPGRGREARR